MALVIPIHISFFATACFSPPFEGTFPNTRCKLVSRGTQSSNSRFLVCCFSIRWVQVVHPAPGWISFSVKKIKIEKNVYKKRNLKKITFLRKKRKKTHIWFVSSLRGVSHILGVGSGLLTTWVRCVVHQFHPHITLQQDFLPYSLYIHNFGCSSGISYCYIFLCTTFCFWRAALHLCRWGR